MNNFVFYSPTEFVFGRETEKQTGQLVARYGGRRVLVVYGGGSVVRSGLLQRVENTLREAGLVYVELGGVQPNPIDTKVYEGIELARREGVDFLLAVGGGSVIDTAKAIAVGVPYEGDFWDFYAGTAKVEKALPVGVVLTIPAAGSEMSDSAVLTNTDEDEKRGLNTDLNRPKFAILDPVLAATLPKRHVACGVVDIMMHTLDRYFNPVTDNEITDEIAEALLRVVVRNGRPVFADPADVHAMSEIMWCGSLSHNGLTGLGGKKDFAVHQLGHAISEKYDAIHGESLSTVWGSWARYVLPANPARFARYARNVWGVSEADDGEAALRGIEATENYFASLNMPVSLGQSCAGVQNEAGLEELAMRCSFRKTRSIGTFRSLGYDDMLAIYRLANH